MVPINIRSVPFVSRGYTNILELYLKKNSGLQDRDEKKIGHPGVMLRSFRGARLLPKTALCGLFGAARYSSGLVGANGQPLASSSAPDTPSLRSQELSRLIKKMIDATGPIPLSVFMKECLINPTLGYYTTRDPLDAKKGDFITSPEISSTFGEIVGIWFFTNFIAQLKYQATYNRGKFHIQEKTFRFIEYGPGRGTLMYDMLRILNRFIAKNNPIEVVFIEKSPVLLKEQHKAVCGDQPLEKVDDYTYKSTNKWGNTVVWKLDDKPEFESDSKYMNFVIAHEFFDALPINRFVNTSNGWREILVDLKRQYRQDSDLPSVLHATSNSIVTNEIPEFGLLEAPYATLSSALPKANPRFDSMSVGSKVEICSDSYIYLKEMSDLVSQSEVGAGLVIDYGKLTVPIETLRGIRNQKFVDPLARPGEVDLSADVDFGELITLLKKDGLDTHVTEQGDWLNNMGLGYRIDQLIDMHRGDDKLKQRLVDSYNRLTSKGFRDMGKIYKVLGFYNSTYSKLDPTGFYTPKPRQQSAPVHHEPHADKTNL